MLGAVAIALVVGLAAANPAGAPPGAVPGFWPDPSEQTSMLGPDGSWEHVSGGVRIVLTALDDDARWEWLRSRGRAEADPFSPRPGDPPGYLSFALSIANDSRGLVVFNPARIWLHAGSVDIQSPLDLATVQSAWRHLDAEMPVAYEKAASALLEGETVLRGGEAREGLLVFRRPKGKPRAFTLTVPMTTGAGEVVELRAAYLEEGRATMKRAKRDKEGSSR